MDRTAGFAESWNVGRNFCRFFNDFALTATQLNIAAACQPGIRFSFTTTIRNWPVFENVGKFWTFSH